MDTTDIIIYLTFINLLCPAAATAAESS